MYWRTPATGANGRDTSMVRKQSTAKKQITQKAKKSNKKKANINEEINDSVIKVISKKRRKKVVA